jgi:hypothetical protein
VCLSLNEPIKSFSRNLLSSNRAAPVIARDMNDAPAFVALLARPGCANTLALAASRTHLLDAADAASTASTTPSTMPSPRACPRSRSGASPSDVVAAPDVRTISSGVGGAETEPPPSPSSQPRCRSRSFERAVDVRSCAHATLKFSSVRLAALSAPAPSPREGQHEQRDGGEHGSRLRPLHHASRPPDAPPPRRRLMVETKPLAAYARPTMLGLCL